MSKDDHPSFFCTWSDRCSLCVILCLLVGSLFFFQMFSKGHPQLLSLWTTACVCLPGWESRAASPQPHLEAHCAGLSLGRMHPAPSCQWAHSPASRIADALTMWSGHMVDVRQLPFPPRLQGGQRARDCFVSCPIWRW